MQRVTAGKAKTGSEMGILPQGLRTTAQLRGNAVSRVGVLGWCLMAITGPLARARESCHNDQSSSRVRVAQEHIQYGNLRV